MLEHKRFAIAATAVSDSIALGAYQSECKFILSFLWVVVVEFLISFYHVLSLLMAQLNPIALLNCLCLDPLHFYLPLV